MTHAAVNNKIFHLWWHPHNFSNYQNENFEFLTKILAHFKKLNCEFGFESVSMSELAERIEDN